jgi:ABC-type bacteriocin/lantibiotic exporter with double-glycine peptidase domain
VIAVSHRQFVIDQADQVITLEGGRIASITTRQAR